MFLAATATFFGSDGPLWLYLVLALAPDISMVGYLAGARLGATAYNLFHTDTSPIALAGVGVWFDVRLAVLVWAAHIGADRLVGYGLKYSSGFEDTHLTLNETGPSPEPVVER